MVELLTVLQRKGPKWADGLLEALRDSVRQPSCSVHKGHEYILSEIGKQSLGGDGLDLQLMAHSTAATAQQQVSITDY